MRSSIVEPFEKLHSKLRFTGYPDNFKSIEETRMGLAQLSTSGHQF